MPQQHTEFSVSRMCRLLAVSRRGDSAWLQRPPSAPTEADQQVAATGQQYCAQGRSPYGTRRSKPLWAPAGRQGSRRCIGRVLAQAGRPCKTRRTFKAPTAAGQAQTGAPHPLTRAFTGDAPDTVSVGDITSLPTGEGWLYLAGVLALCSRAVVGWARADHMRAELVNHAVGMARCPRRPAAGLLMPTDRGSQ
jgi:transposase InsO family protein